MIALFKPVTNDSSCRRAKMMHLTGGTHKHIGSKMHPCMQHSAIKRNLTVMVLKDTTFRRNHGATKPRICLLPAIERNARSKWEENAQPDET